MRDTPLEHPVISIITPSYNQGAFLAETIQSVIGQEGDFSIDYIIIDGASTDGSVNIIRQYEDLLQKMKWPVKCKGIRYRWISEKDKGQADALLKGFLMATGQILAWLNSDDTYLPGALRSAADFFRNHPENALLYGESYYCDPTGAIISRYRTEDFDLDKLAWFNFICQPSCFFTKTAYEAVGGLDGTLQFAMDYDLWIRIGKLFPCCYMPGFLSTYRLHETSKTICDETLFANCEEGLNVTIKHFGWAPLTRIYNSCSSYCKARLPAYLAGNSTVVAISAVICSVFRSIRLNRGFQGKNLRLLNTSNFKKLFKSRFEIMTGSGADPARYGSATTKQKTK